MKPATREDVAAEEAGASGTMDDHDNGSVAVNHDFPNVEEKVVGSIDNSAFRVIFAGLEKVGAPKILLVGLDCCVCCHCC